MKKVLIIVSVVVIALAGIGVGAYFLTREKSPEQQVVGTWYDGENDVTIELKSNKSLKITKESGESRTGTWRIAGDKIIMTIMGVDNLKATQLVNEMEQTGLI